MEEVDLGENELGNDGAASILKGTEDAVKLVHLDLSANKIDNGVVEVLTSVLRKRAQRSVETSDHSRVGVKLCLHANNIGKASLVHVANSVSADSADYMECGIYVVRWGRVQQRDLSVQFEQYAQRGGQGDLWISEMGLGDEGAAQVASLIADDRYRVEVLHMAHNGIGDEGAAAMARGLSTNCSLDGLAFAHNKVGSVGFAAMVTTLVESNATLRFLDLGFNPIFRGGDGGRDGNSTRKAGELLARSRGLHYLGLAVTGVGDEECEVMADTLAQDTCIIAFLNLAANRITSNGAGFLCRGLEKNLSVRYVDLSHNEIDSKGVAVIQRCIQAREKKGRALECVWMESNDVDAAKLSGCMLNSMFSYSSVPEVIKKCLK